MSQYLRDRVIVLKSEVVREHDRRIVMFGESYGLLEAVARGASKRESKQCGHMQPMTEVEVMIAKGIVYDKLAVAKVIHPYIGIRSRLGSLAIIGSFFDLFEKLERPGIVDQDLYALLKDLLDVSSRLPEEPTVERAKLLFAAATLKLLDRTGFSPQITRCALCYDGFLEEEVRQLPQDGALVHEDCYHSVRATQPNAVRVAHSVRAVVRFLREEPLEKALFLTGTSQLFASVSSMIVGFLKQTPLHKEPHGIYTITSIVG